MSLFSLRVALFRPKGQGSETNSCLIRFFKTLREGLLESLPGYKGPDVFSRGERPEDQSMADRMDVSLALQRLDDQPQWPHIATALTRLADCLATSDVPIDYARRRGLEYTGLLPPGRWGEICRRTGTHPGGERREQIIRSHLFQRISGFPPESAPGTPTLGEALFRTEYFHFLALQSPQLAQALDAEARAFLATRHIHDEPVVWQPPNALLDGLALPGFDPDHVDLPVLHEQRSQLCFYSKATTSITSSRMFAV